MTTPAPARARRPRRSTAEVRQRLIDAARGFFRDRGYTGASVRDIAARADVKESVLFRHFGTKAGLFERSVLEPVLGFVEAYTARWSARDTAGADVHDLVEGWLRGMYTLAAGNRELILALLAAQAFEPEHFGDTTAQPELRAILEHLTQVTVMHHRAHRLNLPAPELTTRVSVAMVLGMALLDPWLFPPGGERPDVDRIVAELVEFQIHGVAHRP